MFVELDECCLVYALGAQYVVAINVFGLYKLYKFKQKFQCDCRRGAYLPFDRNKSAKKNI